MNKRWTVRPAYLPLPKAARWAGMSAEQLRQMICRGMLGIYRPDGPDGVALVRLRELRKALEQTRWSATDTSAQAPDGVSA